MRVLCCALALALALPLTGCWVYTANPLAERPEDYTFDVRLLGTWVQPDSGCTLQLTRFFDQPRYNVHYSAPPDKQGNGCLLDEGQSAMFEGWLAEIGDTRFLDITPVDRQPQHHDLPLHSFYRVRLDTAGVLTLTPLDHEWVQGQLLQERPNLVGRTIPGGDNIVLTSSTKQLRDFLRDFGSNQDAFKPSGDLSFRRRAP